MNRGSLVSFEGQSTDKGLRTYAMVASGKGEVSSRIKSNICQERSYLTATSSRLAQIERSRLAKRSLDEDRVCVVSVAHEGEPKMRRKKDRFFELELLCARLVVLAVGEVESFQRRDGRIWAKVSRCVDVTR